MKKKALPLIALIAVLMFGATSAVYAIPIVYVFEGTVTNAGFAEEQYIGYWGDPPNGFLATGDSVYHKVLIDYDLDSVPDYEGVLGPVEHQFSAQYLGGTAMIEPLDNHGYNVFNAAGSMYAAGQLFSGGTDPTGLGDSILAIWNQDLAVYEWTVGTFLSAESNFGPYGHVWEDLTLVSIAHPTPEPASILLIATGLIGFTISPFRKKLRKNQSNI